MEISREELSSHADLVCVEDELFDARGFAASHPGGAHVIRLAGGKDVTALFHSMHVGTAEANLAKLRSKWLVGRVTSSDEGPRYNFASPFALELRAEVRKAMRGKSRTAPLSWWVRTGVIMTLTVLMETLWATTGRVVFGVVTGVLHALIGVCVQHDGSHGAVSKRAWLNGLVSYGADWIGNSNVLWFQQHVLGHHPSTNVEGVDPDAHSAEPFLHFHPNSGASALQHLYMWLVLPMYGPTVVYNAVQVWTMRHGDHSPPNEYARSQRFLAVLTRLFYISRIVVAPMMLAGAGLLPSLLTVPLAAGLCLTFLFVLSHNFEGSNREPISSCKLEDGSVDWFKLQVETSATYGGFISGLLTGGLNFQIEHHIVPNHNSMHYPSLQPVVQRVCRKHGVNYTYFPTIVDNFVSCVRYMASAREETPAAPKPLFIKLRGKRLDVTRWANVHPGGAQVLRAFEERDATAQFDAMHTSKASKQLDRMLASSKLAQPTEERRSELEEAFEEFRAELRRDGLFRTPVATEAFKLTLQLSYFVVGTVLIKQDWVWLGTMIYTLGMQQAGWLSHDYLHHSVFQDRVGINDFVGGVLGWLQGYDSAWWKDRHNAHHVCTNEEGHDPDIDIAPLLTYFKPDIDLNAVQKWQHRYFVPLLTLLHVAWLYSSAAFVHQHKMYGRAAALAAHYAWITWLFYSPAAGFLWRPLMVAFFLKGTFTAIFVFMTHYPEDRLSVEEAASMSFVEQTCRTSRDISGGAFVNWISGCISLQIVHHLLPMAPRANYPLIAPRVKDFCRKHNLPYTSTSLWTCIADNVECLRWKEDANAIKSKIA